MWSYEKRLQFPVNIKEPNAKIAQVIMSQYGGPDGELGASMRYLSQRYSMPYREVAGLLTDEDDYVQVIVDKEVADAEWFGCNPGINTSHLKFRTKDLLNKFLPAIHHRARIVAL